MKTKRTIKKVALALACLGTYSYFIPLVVAQETVDSPVLKSIAFDKVGRLTATVENIGPEGCYIILNGGLSQKQVTTGITSIVASAGQVARNRASLKTKKRYYCRKRNLYVQIEKSCLTSVVGAAYSIVKRVAVPHANLKR